MDNEELEATEEVDVLSLMATESQESDEQDEESEDGAPETLEDALALLERERDIKSKRNKSLKKSKQAIHRTQEENDALRSRLDQLESRLNSQPSGEADTYQQEVEKWQERVADDPSQAVEYTNWVQKTMEDRVANYVGSEISQLKQTISELQGATDPERVQYRSEIDRMRQNEAWADLDDSTLLTIVKGLKGSKVKRVPGGIGGGKVSTAPKEFKVTDELRVSMGFEPRGE